MLRLSKLGLVLAISCAAVLSSAQSDPTVVGQWSSAIALPQKPVHAALLPSGKKLLFWPSFAHGDNPQLFDFNTGAATAATQAGWNIFCAGHAFLPDGRLFVAGGHQNSCPYGLPNAAIYNPSGDSWAQLPDMNAGRWYPSTTTLANGDVLVMAGTIDPTVGQNALPQVWQTASGNWRDLTTAQLVLPQYPRVFLAPNGKVVLVGPYKATRYLDTTGTGKWAAAFTTSHFGGRSYGSAVMYDTGRILIVGGGDPPTATAEIIDLNAAKPAWQYTGSMSIARRQLNATVLPDGKVFIAGGSSGSGFDNKNYPVYPAEIWDPATGKWSTMASVNTYRGYHSVGILLPDGRVFFGGGEKSANSAQLFSPPYLFTAGGRPTITSAPATATYGRAVQVLTPDAANIAKVTLVRLGADTHAFDMNQRLVTLSFTAGAGALTVTLPADANVAPPGHYMLFIVKGNGVPSVATIVQLS